mmetsp:Transcript_110251/g.235458  ORF Transcript_110251/g.235458 Transcript_110251/m.235458 type:complete len:282 (+) Transcript_110251:1206-2051(+)
MRGGEGGGVVGVRQIEGAAPHNHRGQHSSDADEGSRLYLLRSDAEDLPTNCVGFVGHSLELHAFAAEPETASLLRPLHRGVPSGLCGEDDKGRVGGFHVVEELLDRVIGLLLLFLGAAEAEDAVDLAIEAARTSDRLVLRFLLRSDGLHNLASFGVLFVDCIVHVLRHRSEVPTNGDSNDRLSRRLLDGLSYLLLNLLSARQCRQPRAQDGEVPHRCRGRVHVVVLPHMIDTIKHASDEGAHVGQDDEGNLRPHHLVLCLLSVDGHCAEILRSAGGVEAQK